MVTLDLSRVDRKAQGPLELVSYWSHSKPHIKAQLERPNRPAQFDNQLVIKGRNIQKFILRKGIIIVKWCVCASETT